MRAIRFAIYCLTAAVLIFSGVACQEKNEKKVTVEGPNKKVEIKSTEKH